MASQSGSVNTVFDILPIILRQVEKIDHSKPIDLLDQLRELIWPAACYIACGPSFPAKESLNDAKVYQSMFAVFLMDVPMALIDKQVEGLLPHKCQDAYNARDSLLSHIRGWIKTNPDLWLNEEVSNAGFITQVFQQTADHLDHFSPEMVNEAAMSIGYLTGAFANMPSLIFWILMRLLHDRDHRQKVQIELDLHRDALQNIESISSPQELESLLSSMHEIIKVAWEVFRMYSGTMVVRTATQDFCLDDKAQLASYEVKKGDNLYLSATAVNFDPVWESKSLDPENRPVEEFHSGRQPETLAMPQHLPSLVFGQGESRCPGRLIAVYVF